jgi:OOP family OmpA-OmpF porin
MKKAWIALAGVIAAVLAGPAAAQAGANLYLGLGMGLSKFNVVCQNPGTCDDRGRASRLYGGYQVNRDFAIEAGYADLGSVSAGGSRFDSSAWDLMAVALLPLASRFSLHGKAGLYYGRVNATAGATANAMDRTADFTFGAGAEFALNRDVGIRVDYQKYKDLGGSNVGTSDADVLTVGAVFRFKHFRP